MIKNNAIYETLTSQKLTHEQKLMTLAKHAENTLNVLDIPEKTKYYFKTGAINDLFEGAAPYRPRYIQPDYEKFVKNGSKFLQLDPPKTLDEVLNSLMILYRHVPSITNFPVFLGSLDKLIDPFLDGHTDEEIKNKLRLFLTYLDRTITDSFCHANIGPEETRAGWLILEVESELQNAVPNFTIKYDEDITPDDFMEFAIKTSLISSNPAISNHKANSNPYGEDYGICSCYNILPLNGGAYTLTRITLTKLVEEAKDTDDFLNNVLPEALELVANYMNERIKFLVEESGFFESNFLVKENLISKDRFLGMFGVTGLAESANALLKEEGLIYGKDEKADELGVEILQKIKDTVETLDALYSPITNGKFLLHAQVGLESDIGITSGVRIPVGDEPDEFTNHLRHSGKYHHFFPAGVGDIFPIASNVDQNPAALLDVVKGAFHEGVQYMSFYSADTDLVRITGYLVKRSEMEKYFKDEVVLQNTTVLGALNYDANKLAERKVRMV